jgi:hypothetical protein
MSIRAEELRDLAVRTRVGSGAFARWAAQFAGCPPNPESLVYDVDAVDDHFAVLTTTWEGRRARWKSVPCNARERVSQPPLIAEGMVDPWTADERDLRARSEHIAICDGCSGEGKTRCGTCSGDGKLLCDTCKGQRKQYGYAANGAYRLLNCAACRGKGELDCVECRRGVAVCSVCAGEKRVQRWIAIERWQRTSTSEYPPSHDLQGDLAATIDQPRALTRFDLGTIAPDWLERLTPGPAQPGERIARQQLRITRVPRLITYYRVGEVDETAEFSGAQLVPLQASPPASFTARARRLRATTALLVTLGLVAAIFHLGRGLFWWNGWSLAAIAAMAMSFAFAYRAVAEHTAARRRTKHWLNASFAALLLMFLFVFLARPTAAHVRSLIAAGDLSAAERELRALDSGDASFWADIHLARIRATKDLEVARTELAKIPRNLPQFATGAELVDAMVVAEAMRKVKASEYMNAAALLETLNEPGRGRPVIDELLSEVKLRISDATAAPSRAAHRRQRRAAATRARLHHPALPGQEAGRTLPERGRARQSHPGRA